MKRIAMLHYAAPPIVGGVESTIYHHARLLAQEGYEVDVIAGRGAAFHPRVAFHLLPLVDSRHPRVLEAGGDLAKGVVSHKFTSLSDELFQELRELLSQADVCIVHNALTLHKNLALTAALKRISEGGLAPLIAWSHDFAWQDALYTSDLHPGYPWDLLKKAWAGVRYVAVSSHRCKRLAGLFGLPEAEIGVITPGVDEFEFLGIGALVRDLATRLDLLEADPLLLLPARITRRKNIEYAIRVIETVKQLKPRVKLLVSGPPGPHNPKNAAYLEMLKGLREELDLVDAVQFLYEYGKNGEPLHLPDEAVAGLYRLAGALFFPSTREGFGIPILEAGLARLPIFAAGIPPIRESAGDLAYLFDPGSPPQVVGEAIVSRLDNDPAYLLRRKVLDRYTWRAIVQKEMIPLLSSVNAEINIHRKGGG